MPSTESVGVVELVPPSILPSPSREALGSVTIPGDQYQELLRRYDNAARLAAYVLGVLSVGKFDKKAAQTIREKCGEFYPSH